MISAKIKGKYRGCLTCFYGKLFFGFLLLTVLTAFVNGTGSLAAAIEFKDIQGHWAQADIKKAVEAGYIKGFPDATFRPDVKTTRAEFISMLNTAFAVPMDGTGSGFTDVKNGDWFAQSIWSAVKAGYMNIYADGLLHPNQPLSRQEAAALTANLTGLEMKNEDAGFSDGNLIAEWAKRQVSAVAAADIMNGDPKGYFRPEGDLTRGEAVAIINRAKTYTGSVRERVVLAVTGSTVNIRSGPDTAYSILAKVYKEEMLTAILHSENDWYKVTIGGVTGWIAGSYVSAATMAEEGGTTDRGGDIERGNDMETGTGGESGSDVDSAAGENGTESDTGSAMQADETDTDHSVPAGDPSSEDKGSATGRLIVIDAGHGGYDDGAAGLSGTKEKDVTLSISLKLSSLLKDAGYSILLTRKDDTYVSLDERSAAANNAKADIFVSIHCNSSENHTGYGTEILTEPDRLNPLYENQENSRTLAALAQKELAEALGLKDRGIKEQDLSVCRKTNAPAILIETAFIDNNEEEKLLADPAFQDRVAEAVKRGIDAYFSGR